jgi:hypothetical protein
MKVAFEAPLCAMDFVKKYTDFDYAFVHLYYHKDAYVRKYYRSYFEQSKKEGRLVMLDNSAFELERAYDGKEYYDCIREMNPNWYIIPDDRENFENNIAMFDKWREGYGGLIEQSNLKRLKNVYSIGVVHGSCYKQFVECYRYMSEKCYMLAISYEDFFAKEYGLTQGRVKTIERMKEQGVFKLERPHHLLGCIMPQELKYLKSRKNFSIDTSSPILHAFENVQYSMYTGLKKKSKTKIHDIFDKATLSKRIMKLIDYNTFCFRQFTY